MASDTPEIDPGEDGGVADAPPAGGVIGAAIATGAAVACLSCSAAIIGSYCANCGQKNDDMRRSLFVLAADFVKDTFAFDSRMWRTLGLMAAAPGAVPTNYSHGKRSRYTPPVRLFLVVSFLFFLVLGVTHTMFVAVEVRAKTPGEIAADKAAFEEAMREAGPEAKKAIETASASSEGAVVIDGQPVDCDIKVATRFFVRPQDVEVDEERWRACSTSLFKAAQFEMAVNSAEERTAPAANEPADENFEQGFKRVLGGVDLLIANPAAFNSEINVWLPRVMFFMAPILALILAFFIRGRDALLFDHLVLSLYSHATGFAIIGLAILLGQFGVPHVFPAAMAALGVYFIAALKRAYKRGWAKTVYSAAFAGLFYLVILSSVVGSIIANQIWRAAA
ncbi:MAG: DUF3667 domain-containing protein [Pseudomonadota bacterium]